MKVTGTNPPTVADASRQLQQHHHQLIQSHVQQAAQNQYNGYATYLGADSETVRWPDDDDGSAAHEPVVYAPNLDQAVSEVWRQRVRELASENAEQHRRLNIQQEQIGRLICEREQLQREIEAVRALLSRIEDAPTDPVQCDIERTIDHLLNGRTTKDQRKGLNTATERAERVPAGDDAAVGRALR